jgi:hypothetical protein
MPEGNLTVTNQPTENEIMEALQLDIADEANEHQSSVYINRFLHHFRNQYNAKMGQFGYYLTKSKEDISNLVASTELRIAQFTSKLCTFESNVETAINDANANHLNNLKEDYFSNIEHDMSTAVQDTIQTQFLPVFHQQVSELEGLGNSIMENLEMLHSDFKQDLQTTFDSLISSAPQQQNQSVTTDQPVLSQPHLLKTLAGVELFLLKLMQIIVNGSKHKLIIKLVESPGLLLTILPIVGILHLVTVLG